MQYITSAESPWIVRHRIKMQVLILLLAASAAAAIPLQEDLPSLVGANVFRLVVETEEKLAAINAYDGQKGYDLLKYGNTHGDAVHLMVTADKVQDFKAFLLENGIDSTILTENVQEAVDAEAARQGNVTLSRMDGRLTFTSFPRYQAIVDYLEDIASTYSQFATLLQIGTTYEGRPIHGLKISSGGTGKPAILIEAALHAREWIAPVTVLYFVEKLLKDSSNADLLAHVDYYIFPVLNPDGYEFSHTTYRMQRKTRSINPGSWCVGVDGNRNFDYQWMLSGASSNPCSDIYAGSVGFSEVETRAIRDFVLANTDTLKMYLTYHSHGNYFLFPWGFTADLPDDYPELMALAQAADDAQATYRGTRYTIGGSYLIFYPTAGGSDDWMKAVGGMELSYTIELPSGGIFGFDIPASEIISVGEESFLAFRVFSEYVAIKFGTSG